MQIWMVLVMFERADVTFGFLAPKLQNPQVSIKAMSARVEGAAGMLLAYTLLVVSTSL